MTARMGSVLIRLVASAGAFLLAACGTTPPAIQITSPDLVDGGEIPIEHTCDGEDVAPRLEWTLPPRTSTVILIVDDPDAPGGAFAHWGLFMRGAVAEVGPELDAGTTSAVNDFGTVGWRGPCPPAGDGPHAYRFRVWALSDTWDSIESDMEIDMLHEIVDDSTIVGMGELSASYERR
jgi:Raf kinase inhibitor-like YbhB/YbcL family protein